MSAASLRLQRDLLSSCLCLLGKNVAPAARVVQSRAVRCLVVACCFRCCHINPARCSVFVPLGHYAVIKFAPRPSAEFSLRECTVCAPAFVGIHCCMGRNMRGILFVKGMNFQFKGKVNLSDQYGVYINCRVFFCLI